MNIPAVFLVVTVSASDYVGFALAAVKRGTKERLGRWQRRDEYRVKSCCAFNDVAMHLKQ